MNDIRTKLEETVNKIKELKQKLFELEPKVQQVKSSVALLVASLKEVYVKYDENGLIESISYNQVQDPYYVYVKVSNETVRSALRDFLLSKDETIKQYESLKLELQNAKLEYDMLKSLIQLSTISNPIL